MKITKLILMERIYFSENATGKKTVYIEKLEKRVKVDTTDMEYKILRGIKHLIGFTEANELAKGNFTCHYYNNRDIILKPVRNKKNNNILQLRLRSLQHVRNR